jgi:uncharacterized RDD family membrane protein YckC
MDVDVVAATCGPAPRTIDAQYVPPAGGGPERFDARAPAALRQRDAAPALVSPPAPRPPADPITDRLGLLPSGPTAVDRAPLVREPIVRRDGPQADPSSPRAVRVLAGSESAGDVHAAEPTSLRGAALLVRAQSDDESRELVMEGGRASATSHAGEPAFVAYGLRPPEPLARPAAEARPVPVAALGRDEAASSRWRAARPPPPPSASRDEGLAAGLASEVATRAAEADSGSIDGFAGARTVALGRSDPGSVPLHARLVSWLVDLAVVGIVPVGSLVAGTSAFAPAGLSPLDHLVHAATRNGSVFVAALLLGLVTAFVYLTLGLAFGGRTLGDRVAGLRSVAEEGGGTPDLSTAALRSVVAIAGTLAFLAGPLWALVDPRGQALHDKVAGTRTIRA